MRRPSSSRINTSPDRAVVFFGISSASRRSANCMTSSCGNSCERWMSCSIPMVATIDLRQTTSARFTGSGLVLSTRGQGSTGRSTFPMGVFEREILRKFTPCRSKEPEEIIHALSVVHTELVLIHPFREGNGRVARMLATLMGLQSDLPPLGFGKMGGRSRKEYFAAVQAGMGGDYRPMEKIFTAVIRRTLRRQA